MNKAILFCSIFLFQIIISAQNKEQDSLAELTNKIDSVSSRQYMAGDNELFFMPTAYTMPKGIVYLSDYEVFLMNFGFAPGDGTQLGAFMVFPVNVLLIKTFTFGAKQRIINTKNISSALFGTYTLEGSMYTFGGVVSIGPEKINGHLGIMFYGTPDQNKLSDPVLLLGMKWKVSKAASLIAEYTSFATFDNNIFNGFVTLGIRVGGQYFSGELAFVRPLKHDIGDNIISLPFVKVSYYF